MSSRFDLRTGTRILDEVNSPINGKIKVVQSLAWGNHIQAGNLTQSGGVIYLVWKSTIKKLKKMKPEVNKCLILGLGGGSASKLVQKHWKGVKITGVELDPIMIDLGTKYLGLSNLEVDIKMKDACLFCEAAKEEKMKYDLIVIDIYTGDKIPDKFNGLEFAQLVKDLLSDTGYAVFNRLYFGEKRIQAERFKKLIESIFSEVTYNRPEANIMYICKA